MEEALRSVAFALVRFTAFAAHALLFGIVPVLLLVLRPAYASLSGSTFEPGRHRIALRLQGFVDSSLWAAFAATVLAIVLQGVAVSELRGGGQVSGASLLEVFETAFGRWYVLRLPLLAGLAALLAKKVRAASLKSDGAPSPPWWAAWALLAATLLATSSFSGHAAVATPLPLSLANDVVHLAAGATWFGGIVVLAVVLPEGWRGGDARRRRELMRATIPRFSNLAMGAIAVVLLTGIVNSLLHLGAPSDLVSTPYGLALTAKLALFLLILVLGGFNHLVVRRRLERDHDGADPSTAFRRTIAAELAVALAIFAASGILTGLARTRATATPPAGRAGAEVTTSLRSP